MAPHKLLESRLATGAALLGCIAIAHPSFVRPAVAQDIPYIEVAPGYTGVTQPWDVAEAMAKVRSQFLLFGEGDRAWTSLRMVGDNRMYSTNTGIGDDWNLFAIPICQFGTEFSTGCYFQTFGIPAMFGAPRSEWVKYLVEGVESMRNVTGDPPGYTVMWNAAIFGRTKDLNSADGLVGTLLSGLVSTEDGTCLDHSQESGGASMDAGFQLLPGSNCPDPWSLGGTWLGDRPIPADSWVDEFAALQEDFRWNSWQIPDDAKDETGFMGNNFATYGHFNDYNSTVLRKFGDVVPGGAGDSS